ncbi:methylaspartate mutase [Streptomyces chilikensis]|uniref:methylaspartate mutase n=1 Tax=Streptomyces chilikensis TaxID=1194079 RepID=UPI0014077315|nr:methylaspartate mutase [Streptomyces chilikensis]
MTARRASFGAFVAASADAGRLVVQPRMGFADPRRMRAGLERTRAATATTAGTLTVDSYTRVGDLAAARAAVADGARLNGYPIATHPAAVTRALLEGLLDDGFPVQVRHGSARPEAIVRALTAAGLDATEGGPVSYCLPYGRTPLRRSVAAWARACELLAGTARPGAVPHVESFGGCLLGQLCPPGLLVALSVLECLFFVQHGIRSVSLSYAQQTHPGQDEEAVRALRRLAAEFLPAGVDHHVVLYTYMGVYPRTPHGATRLLEASARLAVRSGAGRLIVKTTAEAHRIPTVEENVRALETAAAAAALAGAPAAPAGPDGDGGEVLEEARTLVETVLDLDADLSRSLPAAFERGLLDVPFCLHPDNPGRSRGLVDPAGRLRWAATGAMPIRADTTVAAPLTADGLLAALHHVARRYDLPHPGPEDGHGRPPAARPAVRPAPSFGPAPASSPT